MKTEEQAEEKAGDNHKKMDKHYSFGIWWEYLGKDKKLTPKYKSLKEEITNNKIYPLDISEFNDSNQKARNLINNSNHIKSIKVKYTRNNNKYEMPISLNNILSVIFYTDYDQLSFKFSQTFRPLNDKETHQQIQERNLEFGNLTKYLQQTVEFSGKLLNFQAM